MHQFGQALTLANEEKHLLDKLLHHPELRRHGQQIHKLVLEQTLHHSGWRCFRPTLELAKYTLQLKELDAHLKGSFQLYFISVTLSMDVPQGKPKDPQWQKLLECLADTLLRWGKFSPQELFQLHFKILLGGCLKLAIKVLDS